MCKPPETTKKVVSSNLYDSDSDVSDTERLISERRRLNTEYMEQIEKERQEMQKILEDQPERSTKEETKEKITTEDESDVEMKVMGKSLEELEAERDALLQQVRNPEPPSVVEIPEAIKAPEFEFPSRNKSQEIMDVLDIKKRKNDKANDVNGELTRLKTVSESSTEASSPHSQVRNLILIIIQILWKMCEKNKFNFIVVSFNSVRQDGYKKMKCVHCFTLWTFNLAISFPFLDSSLVSFRLIFS